VFYFTDMDTMWEYNAPQYVDFTKRMEDDRADAYFGAFALVRLFASSSRLVVVGDFNYPNIDWDEPVF